MKVLFIYPAIHASYPLQIAALSAYLKKGGHSVECLVLDVSTGLKPEHFVEIDHKIGDYRPGLLAFSCYEPGFELNLAIFEAIKKTHDIPIICGGYYPSLAPEEVIRGENVDMICRGEGEGALLDLCNALGEGNDYSEIKNLWVKKDGKIVMNPVRPVIEDIDSLPYLDRDIIDTQAHIDKGEIGEKKLEIMAGRGCPFDCTYCVNRIMHNLYPNKNKYVRMRSPDSLISEILDAKSKYNFQVVGFHDDNMTVNTKWLEEFCAKYKERAGMPFFTSSRVETCTDKNVKILKDAGCYLLHMGVESGDEEYRKKYLNRKMSNNDIVTAFKTVKKHGMNVWSFCMIGMPFETKKTLIKTVILNFRLLPAITMSSIYYPLHGTELGDVCYKNGWIDYDKKKKVTGIAFETIIKHPNLSEFEIKTAKWLNVASAFSNKIFWRSVISRIVEPFRR